MYLKKNKTKKKDLGYWTVFMLCKSNLNGAPRTLKILQVLCKKEQQFFSAKDSTSTTFTAVGHHPFLTLDLSLLFLKKMGFILFFYSESVRQTVLK